MTVEAVCFIPCCSSKSAVGGVKNLPYSWPDDGLKNCWTRLENARRGMEFCLEDEANHTPAMYLYTGGFYSAFDAGVAEKLILLGKLRLFIVSAGYGVLDAFEPARNYDAEMKGRVAAYWRDAGLTGIIGDICLQLNPKQVYGFFAGQPGWSGAGAKYRYFFTAGVREALRMGCQPVRAGCFYRRSGRGVTAILGALGKTFSDCLSNGLDCDKVVSEAKTGGLKKGGVIIGYDDLKAGLK